jgi:HSP20 family protein
MAQELRRPQTNVPETSQTGAPARRRGFSESLLSLNPDDFFCMNPFQLMRHFSDEMDRMWSGYGSGREKAGNEMWRPAVDVREHDGQLQVHVELPGVNEKDIKVNVEDDTLIIQGERKRYRAERAYGTFYRAIPLPEGAEAEKANGAL